MKVIYREKIKTATVEKTEIENLDKANTEKLFNVISKLIKRELADEIHIVAMGGHVFCAEAPSKCVEREVFILEDN